MNLSYRLLSGGMDTCAPSLSVRICAALVSCDPMAGEANRAPNTRTVKAAAAGWMCSRARRSCRHEACSCWDRAAPDHRGRWTGLRLGYGWVRLCFVRIRCIDSLLDYLDKLVLVPHPLSLEQLNVPGNRTKFLQMTMRIH